MRDRTRATDIALRADYCAATVDELRKNSPARRVAAIVNQRLLFPHRGTLELTSSRLAFGSWRSLTPGEITQVSMGFLPEYGRIAAGGARGGFPSFGAFKRLGAPLVLDLRTGERVVLLIGYTWWSGATENANWLPALESFASEAP